MYHKLYYYMAALCTKYSSHLSHFALKHPL